MLDHVGSLELMGLCHLLHVWWKPQEGCTVIQVSKGSYFYRESGLLQGGKGKNLETE